MVSYMLKFSKQASFGSNVGSKSPHPKYATRSLLIAMNGCKREAGRLLVSEIKNGFNKRLGVNVKI